MKLALLLLLPLLGAALSAGIGRRRHGAAAWVAGGSLVASLALLLSLGRTVVGGGVVEARWAWIPSIGLDIVLRLDGLALLFALLVVAIGALVVMYARYYLAEEEPWGRFYGLLLLFATAMLGLVLSGNLLQLSIFWEATSLSSFLLIGFWHRRADARQGARQALMLTGAGGLALLGGVLLLGHIVGSYELAVVLASGDAIRAHPAYLPALLLILLGAFTKSAQFPFHFWLPHAMAAPTPVSAYLHSATMVKAGVFLLARLYPALAGTEAWFLLVAGTGLVTLFFGAYTALFQHDLKGLLAYSTISHLGLIVMLFGLGTPQGEVAALFHVINHAIFKASLFMATGIIDHECGTRDMRRINGLAKRMPYTASLAIVAAGSMAGVPLLNGFLSKEMFFGQTLEAGSGSLPWLLPAVGTAAAIFAVAYSARFIHDVFWNGEPVDLPREPHEAPRWMRVPVEALAALCVLVGVLPQVTVGGLLRTATDAVLGPEEVPEYSLAIWHGFNLPLLMSAIALAGGVALYAVRHRLFALHARLFRRVSAKELTDDYLGGLLAFARFATRAQDRGGLRAALRWVLIAGVALGAGAALVDPPAAPTARLVTAADPATVLGAALLVLAAAWMTRLTRRPLVALVAIGTVGLACSLAFARLSAPDLALTQLLVEVATTVLLLLTLHWLPQRAREEDSPSPVRDLALAGATGVGAAALTWALLGRPFEGLADAYLARTVPEGGGANAVNVILADFRGFDTFGEATVLAIASLVVFAILKHVRLVPPDTDGEGRPWDPERRARLLEELARPLLPLAIVLALYLFLRGHQEPGGGFAAGLVVGLALVLQYMAHGFDWAGQRLAPDYRPLAVCGVLLATASGAAAWLAGLPFGSHGFGTLSVPVLGKIKWASATLFEAGIFLTVVGSLVLILTELGRLSDGRGEPR